MCYAAASSQHRQLDAARHATCCMFTRMLLHTICCNNCSHELLPFGCCCTPNIRHFGYVGPTIGHAASPSHTSLSSTELRLPAFLLLSNSTHLLPSSLSPIPAPSLPSLPSDPTCPHHADSILNPKKEAPKLEAKQPMLDLTDDLSEEERLRVEAAEWYTLNPLPSTLNP